MSVCEHSMCMRVKQEGKRRTCVGKVCVCVQKIKIIEAKNVRSWTSLGHD